MVKEVEESISQLNNVMAAQQRDADEKVAGLKGKMAVLEEKLQLSEERKAELDIKLAEAISR